MLSERLASRLVVVVACVVFGCSTGAVAQSENPRLQAVRELRKLLPAVVVNGATITIGQVEHEMNRLKRRDMFSSRKTVDHLTPAATRLLAQDALIEEYLALQAAAEAGIQVTPDEVDRTFKGLIESASPSKSIDDILLEQGLLNQDLMSQGLKNLYIDKIRKQFASTLPSPTDEELREFYEANIHVFEATPERVFARHILIFLPEDEENVMEKVEEKKARALELIARLKEGEKFTSLADRYTEDPGGIGTGGSLGWVLPGLGDRILGPVLFSMEPGQILDEPVRILPGFSIPYLDAKEEAVIYPFEEVKDRALKGWQIEKFKEWIAERRRDANLEYYEELPQERILAGESPKKVYR